jgi:hypothetical protein
MAVDLTIVETDIPISETLARTHCYSLSLDGMGHPRMDLLIRGICGRVIDYAIPRSLVQEAHRHYVATKQTTKFVNIANEARHLFTHLLNSGEGGELLLFCLAESVLGFPQVLCKMYLKTSTEVHFHGADGVHTSVDGATGKLSVWWGESKLHKNATDAIRECLRSLAPLLLDPQSSDAKRERDLQLLRHNVDLDNPNLEAAIRRYLDTGDLLFNKMKYGGLALVGFDHGCYPKHPEPGLIEEITGAIKKEVGGWRGHCASRIVEEKLSHVDLHLFLIPFPSVEEFRAKLRKELGIS